jgi:hypothetical protein
VGLIAVSADRSHTEDVVQHVLCLWVCVRVRVVSPRSHPVGQARLFLVPGQLHVNPLPRRDASPKQVAVVCRLRVDHSAAFTCRGWGVQSRAFCFSSSVGSEVSFRCPGLVNCDQAVLGVGIGHLAVGMGIGIYTASEGVYRA